MYKSTYDISIVTAFQKSKTVTYLLTYSMVQSPSWEANWFAASQEMPRISWNPKVHYRTHKRPPPISILGQPNPVHTPTSHLLEIHPNIIHPSTSRSQLLPFIIAINLITQMAMYKSILKPLRNVLLMRDGRCTSMHWIRIDNISTSSPQALTEAWLHSQTKRFVHWETKNLSHALF